MFIELPIFLLPGWSLHHSRRGCGHLHHHCALAGESAVLADPFPPAVLQTRHQAADPGTGEAQRGIQVNMLGTWPNSSANVSAQTLVFVNFWHYVPPPQCEVSSEPEPEGGAGPDRTGLRQPPRGPFQDQASPAHTESIQRGQLKRVQMLYGIYFILFFFYPGMFLLRKSGFEEGKKTMSIYSWSCSRPFVFFKVTCLNSLYYNYLSVRTLSSFAGWYRVHGLVQPLGAGIWCGTPGENHWRLPGPVLVVRGRQETLVPTLDQTCWYRTTTAVSLQVVPR